MSGGDAALRQLARLKLKGQVRKQVRRLNRPTNIIFAIVGFLLMAGWLSVLALRGSTGASVLPPDELRDMVCVAGLFLVGMTVTTSLSHRGLYLPPSEIELLLSAPVSRTSLVRYRVLSSSGRALFGGIVVGLMAGRHMPRPVYGFAGAFLGTLMLPVIGQGISLLAGSAENRFAARIAKLPFRWINLGLLVAMVTIALAATGESPLGQKLRSIGLEGGYQDLMRYPLLVTIGLPFRPWAQMMTAQGLSTFMAWGGLCIALHLVLFELVARVPIDFRELSLSTSADVARRLRRFNRGGSGSSSWEVSKRAAGRRVPWLFGRGPFGAIAWRKTAAILRKARGTLFTGAIIIGLLTVVSTMLDNLALSEAPPGVIGPILVAMIGTIYLCAGLRFDFREELDQLGVIKSWPLKSWKVFLATILPEVGLVSLFVTVGVAVRGALTGDFHPAQIAIVAAVPLLVSVWASIDNVVFLFAPVRFTPGQEGALHHAGRALVLMFLRLAAFSLVSAGILCGALISLGAQRVLDLSERTFIGLGVFWALVALLVQIALLVALGGFMLKRFDVARHTK